ncbi:hypothetical protein GCM10010967_13520 [Dyadobacter beijingensis]|uniref:Addiction module component n=1 Tax=Dyadobacter beijingensis TaxID=365489 RepID=A0ABQ2HMK8_9BACT|nr:hypothetical protein [Dyadobacter beijingensis]GGM83119.1 hypothetical protein GCM10010967_13520 [Dyadobacter beijingensis]
MAAKTDNEQKRDANWLTAEKLQELRPIIEASAQEKVDQMVAQWTPEFREALRKHREERRMRL